jgi:hypothetical protein
MDALKPCSVCGGRRYWRGDRFWECATCFSAALEGKVFVELAGAQTSESWRALQRPQELGPARPGQSRMQLAEHLPEKHRTGATSSGQPSCLADAIGPTSRSLHSMSRIVRRHRSSFPMFYAGHTGIRPPALSVNIGSVSLCALTERPPSGAPTNRLDEDSLCQYPIRSAWILPVAIILLLLGSRA